mmetsp:Transcript_18046/g.54368  ORF Transcript_18046/g.54368 Transcript_18046/m.54368 type:complete len:142 (+) Transcript_18046:1362-1787(+)|eukprot:scaffold42046_cov34-Tisochrysis_lutea.AAC.1
MGLKPYRSILGAHHAADLKKIRDIAPLYLATRESSHAHLLPCCRSCAHFCAVCQISKSSFKLPANLDAASLVGAILPSGCYNVRLPCPVCIVTVLWTTFEEPQLHAFPLLWLWPPSCQPSSLSTWRTSTGTSVYRLLIVYN